MNGTRCRLLDGVTKALTEFYVFPDVAARMTQDMGSDGSATGDRIRAHVNSPRLSTHLTEVSHDKHLRVNYSAVSCRRSLSHRLRRRPRQLGQQRAALKQINFGSKVERLAGNIRYWIFEASCRPR